MAYVGVGAGIIPWSTSYRKYFKRDYTPKSFSLNLPLELINKAPNQVESYWDNHQELFNKYWSGELARHGNNPLVYLNVEGGGFNCMSFPNPGVQKTLKEILMSAGAPIRASIFGQNASELVQIINITKAHEAYNQIKSFEINVSCPNTKPGECASSNNLEQITNYIKAVRAETDKELIVKLSPIVNVADYIEAIIEAGANAVNISNTIPGEAYNGYTGELLMPVGGVDGSLTYGRMLYNVSSTYQKMKELGKFIPIYASGGITSKEKSLEAIIAGATYVDMGYAFKEVDGEGIGELVSEVEAFLAKHDLDSLRGTKIFNNPEWWGDVNRWSYFNKGVRVKANADYDTIRLKVVSYDHKQFTVKEVVPVSNDSYRVTFTESITHDAGQYLAAMLFINGRFEERPFTLAGPDSIIVHDLKKHAELNELTVSSDYGLVSHALSNLKLGDQVYIRGPLGKGLANNLGKTLAIGGGCGAAAIAELKGRADFKLAFSKECESMLLDLDPTPHIDELSGGVLAVNKINFSDYEDIVLCGPNPMMFSAALEAVKQGVSTDHIYLITESIFKCFNGLCGACDCGGIMICKDGPVIRLTDLLKKVDSFLIRNHSGVILENNYVYDLYKQIKVLTK